MEKFHDILVMVLAFVTIIVGLVGGAQIGFVTVIGLAILVFFGVRAILQLGREHAALKSDLLRDPAVLEFYGRTRAKWAEGKLDEVAPLRRKEAQKSVESIIHKYRPYQKSALEAMFRDFPPEPDEYLITVANAERTDQRGWFVMTNKRLILKDGRTGIYHAVRYADIAGFESKGTMTKELRFDLKDGTSITFSKVGIYPKAKWLEKLRAGWPDQEQSSAPGHAGA